MTGVQVSMLVFGLNSGAYISEMMRAGIESVDPGQMEAGRAVGLSFSVTMIKIVIPQAVKNILTLFPQILKKLEAQRLLEGITLCPETMGKLGQIGDIQLYRNKQLRVYGTISCNGTYLHCDCTFDQPWY